MTPVTRKAEFRNLGTVKEAGLERVMGIEPT